MKSPERGVLVGGVAILLVGLFVARLRQRPAPVVPGGSTPSATAHDVAVDASPARLPIAPVVKPRLPDVPVWDSPKASNPLDDEAQRVRASSLVKEVKLEDGTSARVYPGRPRFPMGAPLEIMVERKNADGTPLTGRGDVEIMVRRRGHPIEKLPVQPDTETPGIYRAFKVPSDKTPGDLSVSVSFSHSGNPNQPGQMFQVDTHVPYGEPAALGPKVFGRWQGGRLIVVVPAQVNAPCHLTLRGSLGRQADGATLATATAEADAEQGESKLALDFGTVVPERAGLAELVVNDLTLWTSKSGQAPVISDFKSDPKKIHSALGETPPRKP